MKTIWLVASGLCLAATLTLSHGLLRAAAAFTPMEAAWAVRVIAALFLYTIVFFVYTYLLKHFDLSALYPIYTALSVIGVSIVGIAFFGESASAIKILGGLLLVIGIVLISK